MSRCMVYVSNLTGDSTVTPVNIFGSDWGGAYNPVAVLPPGAQKIIIASMGAPGNRETDHWGTLYMRKQSGSTSSYFGIYFRLKNENDCAEMGIQDCAEEDARQGREIRIRDPNMPSNGTANADKTTSYNGSIMRWRPASSGEDQIGLYHSPCMFVEIH